MRASASDTDRQTDTHTHKHKRTDTHIDTHRHKSIDTQDTDLGGGESNLLARKGVISLREHVLPK